MLFIAEGWLHAIRMAITDTKGPDGFALRWEGPELTRLSALRQS